MRRIILCAGLVIAAWLVDVRLQAAAPFSPTTEDQKFIPADNEHGHSFGRDMVVEGNLAIITAPGWATSGSNMGSAYVYEQNSNGDWLQTAHLTSNNPVPGEFFAASVDLYGDIAVLGASGDSTFAHSAGAAYVFERGHSGAWMQVAKLFAGDSSQNSFFGNDVAISRNQIIVGAFGHSFPSYQSGAAYIFARDASGQWSQTAKLTVATSPTSPAEFGVSVDIDGDRALIGAPGHGVALNAPGAAYVFEKQTNGAWTETAQLVGSNRGDLDQFGLSVSLNDDAVAIGAPRTRQGETRTGSVQIFELGETGQWMLSQRIDSPLNSNFGDFGRSVKITPTQLLVGAEDHVLGPELRGAAYLYTNAGSEPWTLERVMVGTDSADGRFGSAVAMDGSAAFVGAWRVDFEAGAAYFYDIGPIPEPSTFVLLTVGVSCGISRRRRVYSLPQWSIGHR